MIANPMCEDRMADVSPLNPIGNSTRLWNRALITLIATAYASGLHAATLSGAVATTDGRPISGAMVTAWNEPKNRKETVFTGADGRYALQTSFAGNLTLRARTPYFKDVEKTLAVAASDAMTVDFAAEKLASPD